MSQAITYNIEIETPLGVIPGMLVLNIDQQNISGFCNTSHGNASLTGKFISEQDVICSTNVSTPLGNLDLKISGKFEGDGLSGKAKAGVWGSFPFKGKKHQG